MVLKVLGHSGSLIRLLEGQTVAEGVWQRNWNANKANPILQQIWFRFAFLEAVHRSQPLQFSEIRSIVVCW